MWIIESRWVEYLPNSRLTVMRQYKTGLLKIGRMWRDHVTQVWTITYSAVCRSSSCFGQQVAIFFLSTVRLSCFFSCLVCLGLLQENLCSKFARSGKIHRIWNTLMQVWMTGYRGFYLKLLGCLLTRLNYFSCFGQQVAIFCVEVLS